MEILVNVSRPFCTGGAGEMQGQEERRGRRVCSVLSSWTGEIDAVLKACVCVCGACVSIIYSVNTAPLQGQLQGRGINQNNHTNTYTCTHSDSRCGGPDCMKQSFDGKYGYFWLRFSICLSLYQTFWQILYLPMNLWFWMPDICPICCHNAM